MITKQKIVCRETDVMIILCVRVILLIKNKYTIS